MRLLAALVLVAILLAPAAAAQTMAQPVRGTYQDIYVISGRAIDSEGNPVAGGKLTITLDQPGVRAEPLSAVANCKGDFITYFTLRDIRHDGKARIVLQDKDGGAGDEETVELDPFFRRSDAILRLPTVWGSRCSEKEDVWPVSVSVAARILNRTEEYMSGGQSYHARPYDGIIRLRYETADGQVICPPLPNGPPDACETFITDERGDFRYTFTLDDTVDPRGTMSILLGDASFNATVDPETRIAVLYIEATGQGAPTPIKPAPGAPLGALLAGLVAVALLARRFGADRK